MTNKISHANDVLVFHTADLHIGSCRNIYDYLNRARIMCMQIIEVVKKTPGKHKVVVIAGDLMHGKSPTEPERILAFDFILGLLETGAYVVMVNGNHDFYNEDGVTMIDTIQMISKLSSNKLHVVTNTPRVVDIAEAKASFLCVPCRQNLTTKKLRRILKDLSESAQYGLRYGVVHEAISGSVEKNNYVLKTNCEIPEHGGIEGLLLGDIHIRQKVGDRAWYCGNPYQTRYNDGKDKGILIWRPGQEDPEVVLLKNVPRLIETSDPDKVKKFENTKHSVRYVGSKHIETTAINVTSIPNLKAVTARSKFGDEQPDDGSDEGLETVSCSALTGLREFLKAEGLDDSEIEEGYALTDTEINK